MTWMICSSTVVPDDNDDDAAVSLNSSNILLRDWTTSLGLSSTRDLMNGHSAESPLRSKLDANLNPTGAFISDSNSFLSVISHTRSLWGWIQCTKLVQTTYVPTLTTSNNQETDWAWSHKSPQSTRVQNMELGILCEQSAHTSASHGFANIKSIVGRNTTLCKPWKGPKNTISY